VFGDVKEGDRSYAHCAIHGHCERGMLGGNR
jgi:hypothetical protein